MKRFALTGLGRRRRGMTVAELTIAVGIASFVAIGAISAVTLTLKGTLRARGYNAAGQDAHQLAGMITRDLRNAAGLDGTFTTLDGDTYTTADTYLILRIPSIDAEENIIDIDNVFDRVIYAPVLSDDGETTHVVRIMAPDASSVREADSRVLGAGTFAIRPDGLGAFVVHFEFKAEQEFRGDLISMPVSETVRMRNRRENGP